MVVIKTLTAGITWGCLCIVRPRCLVWWSSENTVHSHGPTRCNRTIVVEEPPPGPRGSRDSRWRPCEQALVTISGARFHQRSIRNTKRSPGFSDNSSSFIELAHDPSSSAQLRSCDSIPAQSVQQRLKTLKHKENCDKQWENYIINTNENNTSGVPPQPPTKSKKTNGFS